MYHHQQKTLRYWYRTALFFSVALLIAWNFAVVLHQVDLTPDHHTHHHCQLFSGVQHGIAKVQPTLSTPTFTRAQHHMFFCISCTAKKFLALLVPLLILLNFQTIPHSKLLSSFPHLVCQE